MMAGEFNSSDFFVAGGTLWGEAPSYIDRPADGELYQLTHAGEYCNVLAARQMGKSSLMVRTAQRLREENVRTAVIDLSTLGGGIATAQEWFYGFMDELSSQLNIQVDLENWWQANRKINPVQGFSNFLRDVVLKGTSGPLVLFIDEIDSALGLSFTDDFYAAIRAAYNARAVHSEYARLTIVLLGVARPADLIRDRTRTPFNIGKHVALTDFRIEELGPFMQTLDLRFPGQGDRILRWVFDWTNGQPYLTQKICAAAWQSPIVQLSKEDVDSIVTQLFLGEEARKESNLRAIRDRIDGSLRKTEILRIYRQVLNGAFIVDEERSPAKNELRLTGLAAADQSGMLQVRNRIYATVFDQIWVRSSLPVPRLRRFAIAMAILAALALSMAGYSLYRQSIQTTLTLRAQFLESASPDVRLNSLAGLFELGGEAGEEGRSLYRNLSDDERLRLFTALSGPQNVAPELVVVISTVYQEAENDPPGNLVLEAMKDVLGQIGASGAPSLKTEIEFWLKGRREAATDQNFRTALSFYDSAWQESQNSGRSNPAILIDRAAVSIGLEDYPAALEDIQTVWTLDQDRLGRILQLFDDHPAFIQYWFDHRTSYPDMSLAIAPGLETPTPTPSPTTQLGPTSTAPATSLPAPPPTSTAIALSEFELAFASDRDGEFGTFLLDPNDLDRWQALGQPLGYERAWWPTFCDRRVAVEAQDLDGFDPQWIFFQAPDLAEPVALGSALTAARLGVPRCSPGGERIAYSAYLPSTFEGWLLVINNLLEGREYFPAQNPSFGYVSWPLNQNFFLSMTILNGDFSVLQTTDYSGAALLSTLAQGKYPAVDPAGSRFVYLCSNLRYLCLQAMDDPTPRLLHAVEHLPLPAEDVPVTAMWSGDGLWIYFASAEDGDWDIYRIHPDGSDLQNLTRDWPSNEIMPALQWGR